MESNKQKRKNKITCTPDIAWYIKAVIVVLLGGLCVAMFAYKGGFRFWKYPVCNLGVIYIHGQKFNITSALLFDITLLISSILMLKAAFSFSDDVPFQHKRLKQILSYTCAVGFFLLIFPYTYLLKIHIVGGAFVVGSLWGLAILLSIEIKPFIATSTFLLYHLILQGSIWTYAVLYTMGDPANEPAQKIGIACLMITLWFASRPSIQKDNIVNYKDQLQSE
jgi:hypothetical protein